MKKFAILFFVLTVNTVYSQNINVQYALLRQNDKVTYINDSIKPSPFSGLKNLTISQKTSLSFGGSYRFQAEQFLNEQFSKEVNQNDVWFLNRLMLHSHLKIIKKLDFFVELNSSTVFSKTNISPVDKDELSVNQLFFNYAICNNLMLLVGRQNMRLGSGRLVDIREGPNVRLSLDMAKLEYKDSNTSITSFLAVPLKQKEGVFDNVMLNTNEYLTSLYITQNWNKKTTTDIYVFYKKENDKAWNTGRSSDNRVSFGLRHFGVYKGLNYDNEFVLQYGMFGQQTISAWTASFKLEKPFILNGRKYQLGLKTEAISGDNDPNDNELNTFDALYPRGAYFGRVARFGPSNLVDIHPSISTTFKPVSISIDYVAFWRFSTSDGLYNPGLGLDYPSVNKQRFIGHQIGTIAGWQISNSIALELETNIIFPDKFLIESGLDETLFHAVFTAEVKF